MRAPVWVLLLGCGSRGPLDIPYEGPDATAEASAIVDASAPDVVEAGRDAGPIVNCVACVSQNCQSQITQCVTDPQCRASLQCAVQNCFQNGGFDSQCLLQKCGQNLGGLAQVLSIVTCVSGKCGTACISLLGGLGM